MLPFSSNELLRLWDQGQRLHPLDQGLLALQVSAQGETWDDLANLPLGQRNRRLVQLRAASFGNEMNGGAECPMCGERLEFALDARELAAAAGAPGATVCVNGEHFRLPTSRDLAIAAREPDGERAAIRLLELCHVHAAPGPLDLSPADVERIGDLLAEADPLAEMRLRLTCSSCGHSWDETLDPATFLWAEIEAQARRLLHDVHVLASAYHWSEQDILSLGDRRRAAYLEMVHG